MFSGGWRVISPQTDGENHCGAPEGKDARSDQAEFCSQGGWGGRCTATFGFCFAHWCQAGTVLETPPTWPPRQQISCISWTLKITSLKLCCGQTTSFLALCLFYTSWRQYELFWFWPDNRAGDKDIKKKKNQMSAELSSDQTSCSNW